MKRALTVMIVILAACVSLVGCGGRHAELSARLVSENARLESLELKLDPLFEYSAICIVSERQDRSENDLVNAMEWRKKGEKNQIALDQLAIEMAEILDRIDETKRLLKEAE